jgi:hypothetical protein
LKHVSRQSSFFCGLRGDKGNKLGVGAKFDSGFKVKCILGDLLANKLFETKSFWFLTDDPLKLKISKLSKFKSSKINGLFDLIVEFPLTIVVMVEL